MKLLVLVDGRPTQVVTAFDCLSGIQYEEEFHLRVTMREYMTHRKYSVSARWTGIYDGNEVGSGGNVKSRTVTPE